MATLCRECLSRSREDGLVKIELGNAGKSESLDFYGHWDVPIFRTSVQTL